MLFYIKKSSEKKCKKGIVLLKEIWYNKPITGILKGGCGMKTKDFVRAGIFSALIVVFLLLFLYLPVFSFLGLFLAVCTVVVLTISVPDGKAVVLGAIVSLALTMLLSDPISGLLCGGLLTILPGLTIGLCFRKRLDFPVMLLTGTFVQLLAMIAVVLLQKRLLGVDFVDELKLVTQQTLASLQTAAGVGFEGVDFSDMADQIMLFLPACFLTVAAGMTLGNLMIGRGVLRRMGFFCEQVPSFSQLQAPRLIAGGYYLLFFLFIGMPRTSTCFAIGNAVCVLMAILTVCGLSFLSYGIKKTGLPKGVRVLLLCLVLPFLLFLGQLTALIGAIDAFADFRKLRVG